MLSSYRIDESKSALRDDKLTGLFLTAPKSNMKTPGDVQSLLHVAQLLSYSSEEVYAAIMSDSGVKSG